jgi:hypothetical protein
MNFAKAQLPHTRFYLGAIADYHPHETVGVDHIVRRLIQVGGFLDRELFPARIS